LNRDLARRDFEALLQDQSHGQVWLLKHDDRAVGYLVLTVGFSMEYGGLVGVLDDLFVRPEYRRRGLGYVGLTVLLDECRSRGVTAVSVEVGRNNEPAQSLYRKCGFAENDHPDRRLMTCCLHKDVPARKL